LIDRLFRVRLFTGLRGSSTSILPLLRLGSFVLFMI
jgi:hypothetical protein